VVVFVMDVLYNKTLQYIPFGKKICSPTV